MRAAADRRPPSLTSTPYNSVTPLVTPTPDGTGYATHVDVVYVPQGFAGWKYLMAMTPYANLDNAKENPCLLVSNDNSTWQVPAGLTNPIVPWPGGNAATEFNSDPDIVVSNDGRVYIYFREHRNGEHIKYVSSTDLVNWTAPVTAFSTTGDRSLSPTVDFDGVQFRMYLCNEADDSVDLRTAPSAAGPWSEPRRVFLPLPDGATPWHMDLSFLRGRFVMTLNEPGNGANNKHIRLATSRDGLRFSVGPRILTHEAQTVGGTVYRGCTDISDDGSTYRIWYSSLSATCRIFYAEVPVSVTP